MTELKVFLRVSGRAVELAGGEVPRERDLQQFVEDNMPAMLGIRFVASEYDTGREHGGRIDSLGLDEDGTPVVVEFKRARDANVISQGLFYLNWLAGHQAEFRHLVHQRYGPGAAAAVEGRSPRLVCIAGDFTHYDLLAVREIGPRVDLVRYRDFGGRLVLLETVASSAPGRRLRQRPAPITERPAGHRPAEAPKRVQELFAALDGSVRALGDDVRSVLRKHYVAYRNKQARNFACLRLQRNGLLVYVAVDPDAVELRPGFTRNVRGLGHLGTGDLEVRVTSPADLPGALELAKRGCQAA